MALHAQKIIHKTIMRRLFSLLPLSRGGSKLPTTQVRTYSRFANNNTFRDCIDACPYLRAGRGGRVGRRTVNVVGPQIHLQRPGIRLQQPQLQLQQPRVQVTRPTIRMVNPRFVIERSNQGGSQKGGLSESFMGSPRRIRIGRKRVSNSGKPKRKITRSKK